MKFEYSLTENDYLTNSLFTASQSPSIRKRRVWGRILIPIVYIILGIWVWDEYDTLSTILFVVFAVLWFFISPLLARRRIVKYYKAAIKESYGQRIGRRCTVEIGEGMLICTEELNESRINLSDVEMMNELPAHVLIKLKVGTIILPIDRMDQVDELRTKLKELAGQLKIPYTIRKDWKWR